MPDATPLKTIESISDKELLAFLFQWTSDEVGIEMVEALTTDPHLNPTTLVQQMDALQQRLQDLARRVTIQLESPDLN